MPGTDLGYQPVFGKYLLLRRIGRGGMAEIFRALRFTSAGTGMQVALKRILPNLGLEPQFVDMFINEAKLASHLDHANIVRILEFGCVDGRLYHCLEYVHGVTVMEIIRALLERRLPVPMDLACLIFTEALYGLDRAHRQVDRQDRPLQIIHRDLTPSNLLVSFEGDVKVADFGIAKATQYSVHTQSGYIKGKFRYMSPEQARGEDLDQRSDLFSLAICFAELLTLKPMFAADGDLATLKRVRAAEFTRPRELNPHLPPALEQCLLRALAREREQRYGSAAEWLEALEQVVFDCGLKCFRSNLKAFMHDLFQPLMRERERELAEEAERARTLRHWVPAPGAGDDPEAGEVRTVVMEAASLAFACQPRPEGSEEPTRSLGPLRPTAGELEVDDQRPTLRDLPSLAEPDPEDLEEAQTNPDGARPDLARVESASQRKRTVHALPAVAQPAEPVDPDLGKRRTLQVPTVKGPPADPDPSASKG